MTSPNRIKVLLISHTCQSATEGQPRTHALSKFSDLELCVVSPQRWFHYGKWRAADLANALTARDRAACGQVAPPHGLYLVRVEY